MNHLHPYLQLKETKQKGRGVFALNDIEAHTLLEISPVIVLSKKDRDIIHQTHLHDYYFIWGTEQEQAAIALGYISIYNHSENANCYHECDFKKNTISIYSKVNIQANEELCINYNKGESNTLWFNVQ